MLFLAVFLGFMAENYRESLVEKARVEKYMKDMVDNLKYDTLRCKINIANLTFKSTGLDSLRFEIDETINGRVNESRLYYFYMKYSRGGGGQALFNRAAITQLKNSGTLRLIENERLAFEINDYYERRLIGTDHFKDNYLLQGKKTAEIGNEFFSWRHFDFLLKRNGMYSSSDTSLINYYPTILEKKNQFKLL